MVIIYLFHARNLARYLFISHFCSNNLGVLIKIFCYNIWIFYVLYAVLLYFIVFILFTLFWVYFILNVLLLYIR